MTMISPSPRFSVRAKYHLAAAFLMSCAISGGAIAQTAPEQEDPAPVPTATDIVILGENAANSTDVSKGRIAVNMAAGDNNQQANTAVIAQGQNALGIGTIAQSIADSPHQTGQRVAMISGDAFAKTSGLIAVNVAAGTDNQEANLAIIALGSEGLVVTDATLSQTRSSHEPTGGPEQPASPQSVTGISQGAFQGSSGLAQVNLIGGERNSSANTFALSVAGGANP